MDSMKARVFFKKKSNLSKVVFVLHMIKKMASEFGESAAWTTNIETSMDKF